MTSYEIVKKNITFDSPERIAYKYPTLGEGDIIRLFMQPVHSLRKEGFVPNMAKKMSMAHGQIDEWGCEWENNEDASLGLGQPIPGKEPIKTWDDYKDYKIPDPFTPGRFDGLEEILEKAEKEEKWVQLNSQYLIFERLHFIRGFENTLMDMYTDKDMLEKLCDDLLEYQLGIVEQAHTLGKGRIHSIDFSDDWGTQTALMISPDMWRDIFKPRYKKLIDKVHEYGMFFNFHSCGKINDILDDFVEMGVDIVNFHQPGLLGFDELSKYAGKIAFDVSVDIQKTMPTGDKELIEEEVKKIISMLGTENGGIIAAEYRFLESISTTQESFEYSLKCFEKHSKLK